MRRNPSRHQSNRYEKSIISLKMLQLCNSIGSTPLQIAAYYGNESTVSALEQKGADPVTSNSLGWSARHYAARWSQPLGIL